MSFGSCTELGILYMRPRSALRVLPIACSYLNSRVCFLQGNLETSLTKPGYTKVG